MNRPEQRPEGTEAANRITATRFIEAFNTDDWQTVQQVVAADYVFHHPEGGTVKAGPELMANVWAGFKAALPDSWHPIPVMIAEGNYVAVLLPTYGNFIGQPYHGIPPTGKWLEYGMVNMVRVEDGQIAEAWFGMDPFVEKQQMAVAPSLPARELSETEQANIALFQQTVNKESQNFDNLTAFSDVVIALGPPQYEPETATREIAIYSIANGALTLKYSHRFSINPPYPGDPAVDKEASRAAVERWFRELLIGHNLKSLDTIITPDILVHKTAMPCEADYYRSDGVQQWLNEQWHTFPDLTVTVYFTVAQGDIVAARWAARGTAKGGFLMLPPTGKTVEYTGVSMYRIEDGRIAEIWETRNTMNILQQLNPEIGGGQHHH